MSLDAASIKRVRATPLFATLTDDQVGCLDGGEIINLPVGTILAAEGSRTGHFQVLLEGEVRITRTYDRQSILMAVGKPGGYIGETMLLLDIPWVATARVTKPSQFFQLDEEAFWHMLTTCRTVAREIFRSASSRMRNMEGYSQQREKLVSLGTMAAGLAHEMNNPAAAARRAAAHLQTTTDNLQAYLCALSKTLNHDQWGDLINASQDATERLAKAPPLDHLTRSDCADTIAGWLDARGVPNAWELAPVFVTAGLDPEWLGRLTDRLPAASQVDALNWLGARLDLRILLTQVEQSTARIGDLVKAVKSYSHMDQTSMQLVNVHEGLDNTLTMLGHKLKNVTLLRMYDRSIPPVMAYGGELNQVWTNLIDNAIDATNGTGKVCISTSLEDDQVVVEIVDNGSGIPLDVQPRLFEPFFTTKSVGAGTGLGLVISNRIVGARHGGEIEFESRPGETRFRVRLPVNRPQPAAANDA